MLIDEFRRGPERLFDRIAERAGVKEPHHAGLDASSVEHTPIPLLVPGSGGRPAH